MYFSHYIFYSQFYIQKSQQTCNRYFNFLNLCKRDMYGLMSQFLITDLRKILLFTVKRDSFKNMSTKR